MNLIATLRRVMGRVAKFNEHHDDKGRFAEGDGAGIVAYHGTPNLVPEFSSAHIGEGEGAQAYGYGLYFAEQPAVAEDYSKMQRAIIVAGESTRNWALSERAQKLLNTAATGASLSVRARAINQIKALAEHTIADHQARLDELERRDRGSSANQEIYEHNKGVAERAIEAAKVLLKGAETGDIKVKTGNVYKVKIDAKPVELLDWEKPISEQSSKVQEAVANALLNRPQLIPDVFAITEPTPEEGRFLRGELTPSTAKAMALSMSTGAEAYRYIGQRGTAKEASELLAGAGLAGIKYEDAGSRFSKPYLNNKTNLWEVGDVLHGDKQFRSKKEADAYYGKRSKEQTHNYVIFDDSRIQITHVNGKEVRNQPADIAKAMADLRKFNPNHDEKGEFAAGPGIVAYHGTPHMVPEFSTEHVGEGQGAQSYGYGLYFAENEGVAAHYQSELAYFGSNHTQIGLSAGATDVLSGVIKDLKSLLTIQHPIIARQAIRDKLDIIYSKEIRKIREYERVHEQVAPAALTQKRQDALEALNAVDKLEQSGNLYQVKINVKPGELLDWDAPIAEQSPHVMDALRYLATTRTRIGSAMKEALADPLHETGGSVYQLMTNRGPNKSLDGDRSYVSNVLKVRGIPGLQYLDEGSRGYRVKLLTNKGEPYAENTFDSQYNADQYALDKQKEGFTTEQYRDGTRNFVIFDDSRIHITHINGKDVSQQPAEVAKAMAEIRKYSDEQARDAHGRFTTGSVESRSVIVGRVGGYDDIKAERTTLRDAFEKGHAEILGLADVHTGRFRYMPDNRTLYWSNEPTPSESDAAKQWLENHGNPVEASKPWHEILKNPTVKAWFDSEREKLSKVYNPDQPRVPKGEPGAGEFKGAENAQSVKERQQASEEAWLKSDHAELYQRAVAHQDEAAKKLTAFEAMLHEVAKEVGVNAVKARMKTPRSLALKVVRRSDQQGYGLGNPKDHVRGSFLLHDWSQVPALCDALAKRGQFKGEANITQPIGQYGFRSLMISTDLGNGIHGEIQVHTPESWALKKKTDPYYREYRQYDSTPRSQVPSGDLRRMLQAKRISSSLWSDYWASVPDEVKRAASSAVIGLASRHSPMVPSKGTHLPDAISKTKGDLSAAMGSESMTRPSGSLENLSNASFIERNIRPDRSGVKKAFDESQHPRDAKGEFTAGFRFDQSKAFEIDVNGPPSDRTAQAVDNKKAQTRDGYRYRGMTEAEFNDTVGAGLGLKSRNDYSTSQEGTSLAGDFDTAQDYATVGRDDPRKTGKPVYVVEVTGGKDIVPNPQGYHYAYDTIPQGRVTRVWKIEQKSDALVATPANTGAEIIHQQNVRFKHEVAAIATEIQNGQSEFPLKDGGKYFVSMNLDAHSADKYPFRITHFNSAEEPQGHEIFKDYDEMAHYLRSEKSSLAPKPFQVGETLIHGGPAGDYPVNYRGELGGKPFVYNPKTGGQYPVPKTELRRESDDTAFIKNFVADWPDPAKAIPAPVRGARQRLAKMDGEQAVRFYVAIPASKVAKAIESRQFDGKSVGIASTPAAARKLARQRKVTS